MLRLLRLLTVLYSFRDFQVAARHRSCSSYTISACNSGCRTTCADPATVATVWTTSETYAVRTGRNEKSKKQEMTVSIANGTMFCFR